MVHCFNDNFSDIYYTTDGSVPTSASTPLENDRIPVTGGTKLTVKAICNQPEYSKSFSGDFQATEAFPTAAPKSVIDGGLHYAYYLLKDTADLAHAKPVFSGRADSSFKLGMMDDPEKYVCIFTGFIKVATEGYHIFGSASWGGMKIFLGRQLVIDQPDTENGTRLGSPGWRGKGREPESHSLVGILRSKGIKTHRCLDGLDARRARMCVFNNMCLPPKKNNRLRHVHI